MYTCIQNYAVKVGAFQVSCIGRAGGCIPMTLPRGSLGRKGWGYYISCCSALPASSVPPWSPLSFSVESWYCHHSSLWWSDLLASWRLCQWLSNLALHQDYCGAFDENTEIPRPTASSWFFGRFQALFLELWLGTIHEWDLPNLFSSFQAPFLCVCLFRVCTSCLFHPLWYGHPSPTIVFWVHST